MTEHTVENKSKRRKIFHIDSPIKSTNSHFRNTLESHASIRKRIIKGNGLKTVTFGQLKHKKQGNSKSKDNRERTYRILLDSGSDGDIAFITEEELSKLRVTQKAYPDTWGTYGTFKTKEVVHMNTILPEFSQAKVRSTNADIKIISKKDKPAYYLIIGIETL